MLRQGTGENIGFGEAANLIAERLVEPRRAILYFPELAEERINEHLGYAERY
jgi:hypothetical protein